MFRFWKECSKLFCIIIWLHKFCSFYKLHHIICWLIKRKEKEWCSGIHYQSYLLWKFMYTFIALRKLLKSVYLVFKIVTLLQATTKCGKLSGKGLLSYGLVRVGSMSWVQAVGGMMLVHSRWPPFDAIGTPGSAYWPLIF